MKKEDPNKPLVSVILPVFKSEAHLEKCLVSISAQTYKNIEIIAVVDYLGDNCLSILRKYKKSEPRLRIYKNIQRYGLARTLNRAIEKARGNYLAFADSNGIVSSYRISKQVKFLQKNPKVAAVGTQAAFISKNGKKLETTTYPLRHSQIYKGLLSGETFKFESALIDKTRLPKDILRFRRNTHYPYVYSHVFTKIGLYKKIANLDKVLIQTRIVNRQNKDLLDFGKKLSFIKVLFESTTTHDYKPSLRSLFVPMIKQG